MNYNLRDKVVVITGASRGLGRELALAFAKENANVVINYLKSEEKARDLLNDISAYNLNCSIFNADVTNPKEVDKMFRFVMNTYGRIDILINNAGVISDHFVNIMSINQWNTVINTNLTGVFLCSRCFSKNMIVNKRGKILNIASIKGQLGSEGQSNYSASKAGVIALTKSLAKELGEIGIGVNAVCPGFIATDLNFQSEKKRKIAERMSVLGLEYGLNDFVNFVLFLASDYIRGVSGQIYNIDSRIIP